MASLRRPELVLLIGICFFDIYFFFQRIQIQLCSLHLSDLILRVYVNSPISSLSRSYSFQISYVPLKYPPRISPEYGIHTRQDPIPPSNSPSDPTSFSDQVPIPERRHASQPLRGAKLRALLLTRSLETPQAS